MVGDRRRRGGDWRGGLEETTGGSARHGAARPGLRAQGAWRGMPRSPKRNLPPPSPPLPLPPSSSSEQSIISNKRSKQSKTEQRKQAYPLQLTGGCFLLMEASSGLAWCRDGLPAREEGWRGNHCMPRTKRCQLYGKRGGGMVAS